MCASGTPEAPYPINERSVLLVCVTQKGTSYNILTIRVSPSFILHSLSYVATINTPLKTIYRAVICHMVGWHPQRLRFGSLGLMRIRQFLATSVGNCHCQGHSITRVKMRLARSKDVTCVRPSNVTKSHKGKTSYVCECETNWSHM